MTAARAGYQWALAQLAAVERRPRLLLATYFGPLAENLALAAGSGFDALHVDLVRAPAQLDEVMQVLPETMSLSMGVIDGRNIWRTNLDIAHALVRRAALQLGEERVLVAPSCSLLHVPVDLAPEKKLDSELYGWLAFAAQKLGEVRAVCDAGSSDAPVGRELAEARTKLRERAASPRTKDPQVRARARAIDPAMMRRKSPFPERSQKQHARFQPSIVPHHHHWFVPPDERGARGASRLSLGAHDRGRLRGVPQSRDPKVHRKAGRSGSRRARARRVRANRHGRVFRRAARGLRVYRERLGAELWLAVREAAGASSAMSRAARR